MKLESKYKVLILFLIVFIIRAYLSFINPLLSSDESYFHVRQVENIINTGKPLFYDPLSWNGGKHHFFATFHYISAFLALIFSKELVFKLLPQLFACLIIFPIYGILKKIVKNDNFALIGAFMSSFIPVFLTSTINVFTSLSFALFLLFLLIYLFMNLRENVYYYIIGLIISSFLHPLILLLSFGLLSYVVFLKIENIKLTKIEKETIFFSVFFPLWVYFIFFRDALLLHSKEIFWQNIPEQMLDLYFQKLSLPVGIYNIGLTTLLLGIYAVYDYLFELKDKKMYLIIGFLLPIGLLLWQKMIPLVLGGILAGLFLCILSTKSLHDFFIVIKKTKFSKLKNLIIAGIIALFIATSLIPGILEAKNKVINTPSKDKVKSFEWIKNNLPFNATVIALPEEGNYLNGIAKVKNIIDTDFLMKLKAAVVYEDVKRIFLSNSSKEVVELMGKYKADYLLLTKNSEEKFNINKWGVGESDCFKLIYNETAKIYKKTCRRVKIFE